MALEHEKKHVYIIITKLKGTMNLILDFLYGFTYQRPKKLIKKNELNAKTY